MCGVAGIFNLNGAPIARQTIKKMADTMAHRGPDGEGFFIENNIALAHRRLAILDVSERGAQPMSSHDGDWVISFNGCIYNYLELQQELRSKGHSFVSTSDTEVISEGLAAYGPSFFERLNGMFVVAAWHKKENTLYLSRDRFGVKPLYYWFNHKSLVFASEVKAIIAHPDYKIGVDLDALNQYFTFQNVFTYNTLFKGVTMLPPANTVKINSLSNHVHHYSWWDYNFTEPDNNMSFDEAKEETKRLFSNAVARQMVSDVPVGSYLSGGMDSGSIAAVASKHVSRLTTFTAGFDMSEVTGVEANYDERRDAELMANHFKTEHYEQVINAGDLSWSLPRLVYHLEDLRVGMSYPNYYISRLASKFVKVCLQGTGGDELYGGYPWRYYRVFKSLNQSEFFDNYYGFWQRLVADEDKKRLFTKDVFSKIDLRGPRDVFERVFTFNEKLKYDTPEHHIENSLYFEIKTFLPGLLLVGDKLAMASGLEERFPFLDNDLVNFSQKIPVRHKLGNLENRLKIDENSYGDKRKTYQEFDDGKNVLRKAMMDFLPERIINRKKQGFSAPDESWYRGENAQYIKDLLLSKKTVSSEFIDPAYVEHIIHEHMDKRINHRLLIWSFMNFEWWCKIFLNNEKFD
ncbi:asparagine synthase (glutamine-hydrolyzing) [Pedobacter nyackensis]|uniref:asparagine synthase (glutamine-hydrolyzing) n=1 Tax=Pedobacter nyackensis TaxID=475255 RepID=A0A1W2C1R6_9SPHI|nr:asparagine synthase (glutamine-hydrolyzing) [Pedobacter nyackensis]SMC79041.1 asparagine synthase (glutamine-hydrolysing) [Pedobacter nyackensis]